MSQNDSGVVLPVDSQQVPRYSGWLSYARLPRITDVENFRLSVLGVPFDSGVTYRPGARFGPEAIRQASRLIKPYNPALDIAPFRELQVVDAGDVSANPFDMQEASQAVTKSVSELIGQSKRVVLLGGDHSIALGALRAVAAVHGPVALIHFDAHLDTWGSYFGSDNTHGTPFRTASEEGLIDKARSVHVGIRGSVYSKQDFVDDEELGYTIIPGVDFERHTVDELLARLLDRVGSGPVYVSVDIDVLDPAFAPGTGTPEYGGMTSRELAAMIRGLAGLEIVAGDVVEVAPAYDHAEITAVAASNIVYDLLGCMAVGLKDDASS